MSSPEERLRDALHADEPGPLDPERIIQSARHRRAVSRARVGALVAVVVVAGAIGVPAAMEVGQNEGAVTATAPEASTRAPVPAVPDHAGEEPSSAAARPGRGVELIPGRTVTVDSRRWCIIDLSDSSAPQCRGRGEHTLRTMDAQGAEWLVVVAPSGPRTNVLQVEQRRGWVDLRTSRVPGSAVDWAGVMPAAEAPDVVTTVRALDDDGVEVWPAG